MPKRTRELVGNGAVGDDANNRVTTPNTPMTPITPTTPQMCSASSPDMTPVASDLSPQQQQNHQHGGSNELTVYDIILCVSQAHRANCTYTDELTNGLLRKPISLKAENENDDGDVSEVKLIKFRIIFKR